MNTERRNIPPQGSYESVLGSTMSLVGRLEDLSLGEILQIVSLSKRSGLLRLETPHQKANIYIRAGKVIHAARSDEKEGLLSLLVHHGLLDKDQVETLRSDLADGLSAEQLRGLLAERLDISPASLQGALRRRVQELVYSLFHWEEGTFSFQLVEDEADHPYLSAISPLFLEDGVPAQFLVMEGARRKDELGRGVPLEEPEGGAITGSGEWEEEFELQLAGEESCRGDGDSMAAEPQGFEIPSVQPPLPEVISGTMVIVGLGRALAARIARGARAEGRTPLVLENGAEGLDRIQELRRGRINPFLVLDAEAPGITDSRNLGGLEVLSTLWDLGFSLPLALVCRRALHEDLEQKLEGVPGLHLFTVRDSTEEEGAVEAILAMHRSAVSAVAADGTSLPEAPRSEGASASEGGGGDAETYYDIEQELSEDLQGIDLPFEGWEDGGDRAGRSPDPRMDQLSSFVGELGRQDISGEITLLALRFASSFLSRSVLFLVRKQDLKGLGQFGVDLGRSRDADAAVRSLKLPLGRQDPFSTVSSRRISYKGPPTGSDTEKALFEALGGGIPGEVYVGPIVSMGKVAVLLYGDDYPGNEGIDSTQTLDIFLSHVGLALDRAFLEMKLSTRD